MTNRDFFLFGLSKNLDNQDEDDDEKSPKAKSINKTISDSQKLKFNDLKKKRIQLKQKYENKLVKKLKKNIVENETFHQLQNVNTLTNNSITDDLKELISSKRTSDLEKEIDISLKNSQIEQAVQLSDQLALKEYEIKIKNSIEASHLQLEIDKKKSKRLLNKKNLIKWRFEPKQRWETKSNM
jgi:hypothetical protein